MAPSQPGAAGEGVTSGHEAMRVGCNFCCFTGGQGDGGFQTISSQIRKSDDIENQGKVIGGKLTESPAATQLPAPQKLGAKPGVRPHRVRCFEE